VDRTRARVNARDIVDLLVFVGAVTGGSREIQRDVINDVRRSGKANPQKGVFFLRSIDDAIQVNWGMRLLTGGRGRGNSVSGLPASSRADNVSFRCRGRRCRSGGRSVDPSPTRAAYAPPAAPLRREAPTPRRVAPLQVRQAACLQLRLPARPRGTCAAKGPR